MVIKEHDIASVIEKIKNNQADTLRRSASDTACHHPETKRERTLL
jgi:hypothetical protein